MDLRGQAFPKQQGAAASDPTFLEDEEQSVGPRDSVAPSGSAKDSARGSISSGVKNLLTASLTSLSAQRLSSARSERQEYETNGRAVQITRTLSLTRKEWDRLLDNAGLEHQYSVASTRLNVESGDKIKHRSILGLPIITPLGNFSIFWHMKMLILDLTYTAFIVPIGVGFNISDTAWTWGAVCDFTAGGAFFVDFLLGFHTGYVVSHGFRKVVVMEGKQVARWYITHGSAVVDFLSSVAWITQVVLVFMTIAGYNESNIASQIQILRLLRLIRLARLFKSIFMSATGQGVLQLVLNSKKVNSSVLYFMQLLYSIAVLINFLGCFWYWVADREGIDDTWITAYDPFIEKYGEDDELNASQVNAKISKPELYITSIYWAFTTVSTVGYGDITAQTVPEKAVNLFVFLVGIIFFGVLIGSLTQLLQTASKEARKAQSYREKMNVVEGWLTTRPFPANLRKRIREFYWQFWLRQAEEADEAELLQELPHNLQTEALWSMSKRALSAIPALGTLPRELQFLITSHVRPRKFAPGADISVQGSSATKMYLLEFGQVRSVYNDVEGSPKSEPYMLNSVGLLQEILPRFQKNIIGFRTETACGVWEFSLPSILALCKHHPGLFDHMAEHVIVNVLDQVLAEPATFPTNLRELLMDADKKLRQRMQLRDAALAKDSQKSGLDTTEQSGHQGRTDSAPEAAANGIVYKTPASHPIEESIPAVGNAHAAECISSPFDSMRLSSKSIRAEPGGQIELQMDDPGSHSDGASGNEDDSQSLAAAAENVQAADAGDAMSPHLADALSSIQDQIAELRNLVLAIRDT